MKRGEIIIFEYPFTDQSGSKRRPALVIQSDAIKSPDILVAAISAGRNKGNKVSGTIVRFGS